jgi:hypothetical protein
MDGLIEFETPSIEDAEKRGLGVSNRTFGILDVVDEAAVAIRVSEGQWLVCDHRHTQTLVIK